jgi:hypothetical protein
MKSLEIVIGAAVLTGILGVSALTLAAEYGPNKFGDLPLNTKFYFLADTNHTYLWTKVSATSGSNTVTRAVAPIKAPTVVDSEKVAHYTCPMHPEVVQGKPGACPKCGMSLVEKR